MADRYSVHGQHLVAEEDIGLPRRFTQGAGGSLLAVVLRDQSVIDAAEADRDIDQTVEQAAEDAPETLRADESDQDPDNPEILEPDGWWGVRTNEDGPCRAGITYSGFLFELLLDEAEIRQANPAWTEQTPDAVIRFASDPEASFEFPLGNCLERLIVPLWLMLANSNIASVHAGAVIDKDERLGWMWTGPSGAGKSSIVAEMVERANLRPCADETAVLQIGKQNGAVTLLPGAPWLRLYDPPCAREFSEGSREISVGADPSSTPAASGELPDPIEKRWYRYPQNVYPNNKAPLQRWFLLRPDARGEPSVSRISGSEAATSLLGETIDFNQRDQGWAKRRFKNAMAVARRIPGFAVHYDKSRHTPSDIAELLLSNMHTQR